MGEDGGRQCVQSLRRGAADVRVPQEREASGRGAGDGAQTAAGGAGVRRAGPGGARAVRRGPGRVAARGQCALRQPQPDSGLWRSATRTAPQVPGAHQEALMWTTCAVRQQSVCVRAFGNAKA